MSDELNELVSNYSKYNRAIEWVQTNIETLKKEDWNKFIIAMTYLNPQSYGPHIQNRLIDELRFTRLPANKGQGDFQDSYGDYCELKVSMSKKTLLEGSKNKGKIHLVQIRPWQNSHYYFMSFIITESDVYAICFRLNHSQMVQELELTNAAAAHGTKEANESNKNIERRLTLTVNADNDIFKRWFTHYRSNFFDSNETINSPKTLDDIRNII